MGLPEGKAHAVPTFSELNVFGKRAQLETDYCLELPFVSEAANGSSPPEVAVL